MVKKSKAFKELTIIDTENKKPEINNDGSFNEYSDPKIIRKYYQNLLSEAKFGCFFCELTYENNVPIDAVILDMNQEFIRITGFKPAGKYLSYLLENESRSILSSADFWKELLESRQIVRKEIYSVMTKCWINLSLYCPGMPYIIGTVEDITARKIEREEQRINTLHYKLITENSKDLITQYSPKGLITWLSPSVKKLLGYEPEKLVGNSPLNMIHPEDKKNSHNKFLKNIEQKNISDVFTCRLRHSTGEYIWVETVVNRITAEDGTITGYLSTSRDITNRMEILNFLKIERDLSIELNQVNDLETACTKIQDALFQIPGVDSGGVYLVNPDTHDINLVSHKGLSKRFVRHIQNYPGDSPKAKFTQMKIPLYGSRFDPPSPDYKLLEEEGILSYAMIPVVFEGKVVAAMNLASHHWDEIPDNSKNILETIASHLGSVLARLMAEKALSDSQRNFEVLYNSIHEYIFIQDLTGRIIMVNPLTYNNLGYSQTDLIGKPLYMLHPPELRSNAKEIHKEIYSGKYQSYMLPLMTKDGKVIPAETKVTKGIWNGKEVLIGISRDLTERITAEEAAKASDTQFRQIVETANEGIWTIDKKNVTTFLNQEIANMLGYSISEILGKSVKKFFFKEDFADHLRKTERRKNGFSDKYERRFRRKDGSECWAIISTKPVYDSQGQFSGSFAMMTDITDRKRLEDQLIKSEKRYREIVERQGEGIYITDKDAVFIYTNPIADRLFGAGLGELVGRNAREFLSPDQIEIINEQMALRSKKIQSTYELTVTHPDGHLHHLLITATSRLDEQQNYIGSIGICRDITQRKAKEEKLRYMSSHDTLTGLFNRSYYEETMHTLEFSHEFPVSIIMLDVDGLKGINDQYGHVEGDHLLEAVADILKKSTRDTDISARIGGDEFIVILPSTNLDALANIISRIESALAEQNNLPDRMYQIQFSIGWYTAFDVDTLRAAVEIADVLMYKQKSEKKEKAKQNELT